MVTASVQALFYMLPSSFRFYIWLESDLSTLWKNLSSTGNYQITDKNSNAENKEITLLPYKLD